MSLDKKVESAFYIANQQDGPYDEVQKIIMAYETRQPIILGGNPGSGKTQLAKFISSVLNKPIHRINCEPDMTVGDLLGKEALVSEGEEGNKVPVTGIKAGRLVEPMSKGEIAYLDEFNKLPHGVQKGLNAVLEEDSTYSLDGVEHRAHDETLYIMAQNPGTGEDGDDLSEAVLDRLEYTSFHEQPRDFQVRVAMVKAGILSTDEIIDEDLEERGIEELVDDQGKKSYRFLIKGDDGSWYRYGGHSEKVNPEGRVFSYFFYTGSGDGKLTTRDERAHKYYNLMAEVGDFIHDVQEVIRHGSSALPDDFREALGVQRFDHLNGHMPSFREMIKSARKYTSYVEKHGSPEEMAKEQIAYDIVSKVTSKLTPADSVGSDISPRNMLLAVAQARGLIKLPEYANIPGLPERS